MKQLKISKLMDEYTDTEFFPTGGSAVDPEAVKERVLARAAPAKRRRIPSLKTVLLAAVLAVGCLLSIAAAAGLPMRVYQLVSGSVTIQFDETDEHAKYFRWGSSNPIVLEDGRLWLVLSNEERTDITELIDADTPYIVEGIDPETGLKSYLAVGGTPEDYGWYQVVEVGPEDHPGSSWNTFSVCYEINGELVEFHADEERPSGLEPVFVNKPWYENAIAQLDLWS